MAPEKYGNRTLPPIAPQTAPRSDLYVANDRSSFVHINDFLREKRAFNDEDPQTTVG